MDEHHVKHNEESSDTADSKPVVRLLLTESDTMELYNKQSCCIVLHSEEDEEYNKKLETEMKTTVNWENTTYKSDKSTQTYYSKCFQVFKHKST